jgi:hypothetical protein
VILGDRMAQRSYRAETIYLASATQAWIASSERLFDAYRSQVLARNRFAGTPYLLQRIRLNGASNGQGVPTSVSQHGTPAQLFLRGLPGSGLHDISLSAKVGASRRSLVLNRGVYGLGPNRHPAIERLPVPHDRARPGPGLARLAQALNGSTGGPASPANQAIAEALVGAAGPTLALFNDLGALFGSKP